jgi:LPS-assembly lipoprotein
VLRAAFAGAGIAMLAACGFSPAYAPGAPAAALRNAIRPDPPADAVQFAFAGRIEERFGAAPTPRFSLGYAIDITVTELAVTPNLAILRYNLSGRAAYDVREIAGGNVLTQGQVESFTSFSAIGTTVATRASLQDAERRLGVILADAVVAELIALAPGWVR